MNTTGKLSSVISMDQEFFPRPWRPVEWEELDWARHFLELREKEGRLLGFALFSYLPGDDTVHLLKICLRPESRGTGEASSFWGEILSALRKRGASKVFLEVEEGNLNARGFYKKVGFKVLRTIKAYYSDGENAVTMLLEL